MGSGEDGGGRTRPHRLRTAFLASFLDASFVDTVTRPAQMRLIRPPDPGPPATGGPPAERRPPVHQGHAIWLGSPDAELYRVDDWRWLLRSERAAAGLVQRLAATAGPAGAGDLAAGDPDEVYHLLARCGTAVARLRVTPGEGVALPGGAVAQLGSRTRAQVAELAVTAGRLRRPGWHPASWRSPRGFGDGGPGSRPAR